MHGERPPGHTGGVLGGPLQQVTSSLFLSSVFRGQLEEGVGGSLTSADSGVPSTPIPGYSDLRTRILVLFVYDPCVTVLLSLTEKASVTFTK